MNRRKEERYKRAMARLSSEHVAAAQQKVDAAIANAPNKKLPENFMENYVAHKLGARRPKENKT